MKKQFIGSIFFLYIAFLFFRLYHLGYHDLWYDEVCTARYAMYPGIDDWSGSRYAILIHFWTRIFGCSEFSLRFPSLLFSFLSIILLFIFARKLFNKRVAIFASLFMGLSPFHIWYAQEARSYATALFFSMLGSYLLFRIIKNRKSELWIFFIMVSIIGIYTNYFYLFLFIAHGAYLIVARKSKLGFKETLYFLIILLCFTPYLSAFFSLFFCIKGGFWIPQPTGRSLIITLENFILGYSGFPVIYLISDILVGIFLLSAIFSVRKSDFRESFLTCALLFILPVACVYIFSKTFFSVYLDRGLIIFSPYFYLLLSVGIVSLKRMIRISLLTILITLLLVGNYIYFKNWMFVPFEHRAGAFLKKPFRPISKFIESNFEKGDIICVTNINPPILPSLLFYSKPERPYCFIFTPGTEDPNSRRPILESKINVPIQKIGDLKYTRLWLIVSDGGDRSGALDENSKVCKSWVDKIAILKLAREFDGLWLFLYECS